MCVFATVFAVLAFLGFKKIIASYGGAVVTAFVMVYMTGEMSFTASLFFFEIAILMFVAVWLGYDSIKYALIDSALKKYPEYPYFSQLSSVKPTENPPTDTDGIGFVLLKRQIGFYNSPTSKKLSIAAAITLAISMAFFALFIINNSYVKGVGNAKTITSAEQLKVGDYVSFQCDYTICRSGEFDDYYQYWVMLDGKCVFVSAHKGADADFESSAEKAKAKDYTQSVMVKGRVVEGDKYSLANNTDVLSDNYFARKNVKNAEGEKFSDDEIEKDFCIEIKDANALEGTASGNMFSAIGFLVATIILQILKKVYSA